MNKAEIMRHIAEGGYRVHKEQEAVGSPTIDEQAESLHSVGEQRAITDRQSEGLGGESKNPVPLGESMTHYPEQFVESFPFSTLIIWADILNVPHDEYHWPDPDKEDDLRVAVAEAMEKVSHDT